MLYCLLGGFTNLNTSVKFKTTTMSFHDPRKDGDLGVQLWQFRDATFSKPYVGNSMSVAKWGHYLYRPMMRSAQVVNVHRYVRNNVLDYIFNLICYCMQPDHSKRPSAASIAGKLRTVSNIIMKSKEALCMIDHMIDNLPAMV